MTLVTLCIGTIYMLLIPRRFVVECIAISIYEIYDPNMIIIRHMLL